MKSKKQIKLEIAKKMGYQGWAHFEASCGSMAVLEKQTKKANDIYEAKKKRA